MTGLGQKPESPLSAIMSALANCGHGPAMLGWKNPSVYLLPCLTSYAGNLLSIRPHPKISVSRNGGRSSLRQDQF